MISSRSIRSSSIACFADEVRGSFTYETVPGLRYLAPQVHNHPKLTIFSGAPPNGLLLRLSEVEHSLYKRKEVWLTAAPLHLGASDRIRQQHSSTSLAPMASFYIRDLSNRRSTSCEAAAQRKSHEFTEMAYICASIHSMSMNLMLFSHTFC